MCLDLKQILQNCILKSEKKMNPYKKKNKGILEVANRKKSSCGDKNPRKTKREAKFKKKCKQCEHICRSKPAQSWELGCDISKSKDL